MQMGEDIFPQEALTILGYSVLHTIQGITVYFGSGK